MRKKSDSLLECVQILMMRELALWRMVQNSHQKRIYEKLAVKIKPKKKNIRTFFMAVYFMQVLKKKGKSVSKLNKKFPDSDFSNKNLMERKIFVESMKYRDKISLDFSRLWNLPNDDLYEKMMEVLSCLSLKQQ